MEACLISICFGKYPLSQFDFFLFLSLSTGISGDECDDAKKPECVFLLNMIVVVYQLVVECET
jgi:hypothetical protein